MIERLRHRIILQAPTTTKNATGGNVTTWADAASVWAEVKPLSAYERARAGQVGMDTTHKITIRYRPGVTGKMRIRYDNREFDIDGVMDKDERHEWLELTARERT